MEEFRIKQLFIFCNHLWSPRYKKERIWSINVNEKISHLHSDRLIKHTNRDRHTIFNRQEIPHHAASLLSLDVYGTVQSTVDRKSTSSWPLYTYILNIIMWRTILKLVVRSSINITWTLTFFLIQRNVY